MKRSAIPESARRLVAAHVDDASFAQAEALAQADRVHLVKPPPWPVVARVREIASHVVTVHYTAVANHLRGECTCDPEATTLCAHAAAAALVAFASEHVHAEADAEAARQALVGEWLAELGRQEEAPAVPAATRAIAYVIDLRDGELGLTVLQCPRLKTGELGAGTPIGALGDPQRGAPRWVGTDDLRRIAMLRAVTRALPAATRLRFDRLPPELVRELADCGQLHWDSPRTPPLTYGPPITAQLDWQRAGDGYRIGLASGLVIAPALACHYIDPTAARIGPLELGVPAALVPRLIASPPVPAAMRATVVRSLRPLLTEAAGPLWLPEVPEDPGATVDVLEPRMIASLEPDQRNAIRLVGEARYGAERFPLTAWDPTRPIARDLVAEGRLLARLHALAARLPHGLVAGTSLGLLANARHVAEVIVPTLRAEGWRCILDDDFPQDAPLVDVTFTEQLRPAADGRGWFTVELGVELAGRTVPLLPILLQAIRDGQIVLEPGGAVAHVGAGINLRLPEGELVHVPAERVQRWLRPLIELELQGLDARGALAIPPVVAAQLDTEGRFGASAELNRARDRLTALVDLAPAREPAGFGGALRDYQRVGLAWLRFLHDAGYGGVLADEMGLGKTVQLLAFLDGLRADGQLVRPALVVAPRSLLGNWQREAQRFAPALRSIVHIGADRALDPHALAAPLVITSYQTLARDLAQFRAQPWTTVIFDEAQALKNPDTQARAAAAALAAQSRFCVTGTPIENHLGELWSQIDLAMPGVLGRRRAFEATYRRAIEKHGDAARLELLRQRVRPFLLRRTKERVLADLPAKTEIVERIELDTAQRDLYETLRLTLDARVKTALARRGLQGASMAILDALLKLRQCCGDPRLVKVPEARRVTGSAKLERLLAMLEELVDSGRATLVFSQWTAMLGLIEAACAQAGISTLTLSGATRDRDEVVRRFQAGEVPVLLVSLKAGGVGLNLTRADTVIHYEPWWNPAAEAQATDRAHRIGQDRPVMVYRLVARGTLEEEIGKLQDEKRRLTEAALVGGGVTHLAADDLRALYQRVV